MNYTVARCLGEIRLTDYEQTHVRFLFQDNPYGLVATTLPQAQIDMQLLSQDMADMSGLAVNGLNFGIVFDVEADPDKPIPGAHVEWLGLVACEAVSPLGVKSRVMNLPVPHPGLIISANELNLLDLELLAYAKLYTDLAASHGGSAATLRGGAVIQHDAFETPILEATLKIHHPKIT